MNKINLGIIFGGRSSEHEVSRTSASAIINNVSKEKYNIYMIGITKKGEWIWFNDDVSKIESGEWENCASNKPAFISPDSSLKGLVVCLENKAEVITLDAVIPVLHGKNGEDGTIQGLLTLAGIPFAGCDTASSAACMDKVFTNSVLAYHNIKKPAFHWFYAYDFKINPDKCVRDTELKIKSYPMFIKPANAGSSVGITKAENREELVNGIKTAIEQDSKILVEQGIDGQEVECAVLGNDEPIASVVGEIVPANDFYDYDAKYSNAASLLYIPARIPKGTAQKLRAEAVKAYKIMGCSGLSRVDFFVKKGTGEVILNEINTFPGFTSISMYPKLMEAAGIGFSELIDRLVELAINRHCNV